MKHQIEYSKELGFSNNKHHENVLNAYKEWCYDMQRLQPNARAS